VPAATPVSVTTGGTLTVKEVTLIADAQVASAGVLTAVQVSTAIEDTINAQIAASITTTQASAAITPIAARLVAGQIANAGGALTATLALEEVARQLNEEVSNAGVLTPTQVSQVLTPVVSQIVTGQLANPPILTSAQIGETIAGKVNDQVSNGGTLTAAQATAAVAPTVTQAVAEQTANAGALTAAQVSGAVALVVTQIADGQVLQAGMLKLSQINGAIAPAMAQQVTPGEVAREVAGSVSTNAAALSQLAKDIAYPAAASAVEPPIVTAWGCRLPSRAFALSECQRFAGLVDPSEGILSFAEGSDVGASTSSVKFDEIPETDPGMSVRDMLKTTYVNHWDNKQGYAWVPRFNVGGSLAGPFCSPFVVLPLAQCWGGHVEGYLEVDLNVVVPPQAPVEVSIQAFTGYQGSTGLSGGGGAVDSREPLTPAPEIMSTRPPRAFVSIPADTSQASVNRKFVLPIGYQRKAPFTDGAIDNQYLLMATVSPQDAALRVQFNVTFIANGSIANGDITTGWEGTSVPPALNVAPAS